MKYCQICQAWDSKCPLHQGAKEEPPSLFATIPVVPELRSMRKFGVEIEFYSSRKYAWTKRDGSLKNRGIGQEWASPILWSQEGIEKIAEILNQTEEETVWVDKTCGLHVHVDVRGVSWKGLLKVVAAWDLLEEAIYELLPDERRQNEFCLPRKGAQYYSAPPGMPARAQFYCAIPKTRYYGMNLHAVEEHRSIEFRIAPGAIDPDIIQGWVAFYVTLVEFALTCGKRRWRRLVQDVKARGKSAALESVLPADLVRWVRKQRRFPQEYQRRRPKKKANNKALLSAARARWCQKLQTPGFSGTQLEKQLAQYGVENHRSLARELPVEQSLLSTGQFVVTAVYEAADCIPEVAEAGWKYSITILANEQGCLWWYTVNI